MLIIEDLNTGAIHSFTSTCITKKLRTISECDNIIVFIDKLSFKNLTKQQKLVLSDYVITEFNYDVFKLPALEIVVFKYSKPSDVNRIKDGFVDYKNAHGISITHNYFLIRPFIIDEKNTGVRKMVHKLPNLPLEHVVECVDTKNAGFLKRLAVRFGIYTSNDLKVVSDYTLKIANDQAELATLLHEENVKVVHRQRDVISNELKDALILVETTKNSYNQTLAKLTEEKVTSLDDQSRRYEMRLRDNDSSHVAIQEELKSQIESLKAEKVILESKLDDVLEEAAEEANKPKTFTAEEVKAIRELNSKYKAPITLLAVLTHGSKSALSRLVNFKTYTNV